MGGGNSPPAMLPGTPGFHGINDYFFCPTTYSA